MRTLQTPSTAIELADLQAHIRTLITLEEAAAPVLSCYVNLDRAEQRHASFLDQSFWTLRRTLNPGEKESLESAIESITAFLGREHAPTTKGIAIFSRGGERPFFLALQFVVPVKNRVSIDSTPNIHQLVELKDAYHRYVVMISTAESVRILEVNLGAITRDLWTERPELRDRVGKEWARDHYQAHRRNRGDCFLAEKIAVLDRLMSSGGHTHLILAGTPAIVARVRSSLPKHLSAKVIDTVPESKSGSGIDVVEATLSRFVERGLRCSVGEEVSRRAGSLGHRHGCGGGNGADCRSARTQPGGYSGDGGHIPRAAWISMQAVQQDRYHRRAGRKVFPMRLHGPPTDRYQGGDHQAG